MVGTIDGAGASASTGGLLSPISISFIVLALQLIEGYLEHLKKESEKGTRSNEEAELRQDIKKLLKEASLLSTPSTFAQAAKLRRMAAVKEKELLRKQEEQKKEQGSSYGLYKKILFALKVLLFVAISWRFWGVPVAAVPQHLLQPFGRILSWRAGNAATGLIMVGILPWLVLTSRVSKFLSQKLWKKINHKKSV